MARSRVNDLTVGSPMKHILGFMLPLLFGLIFQQFYNMVDTVVVGQYLGVNALAGVGSTGSVNFLVLGFVIGLSSGFTIPVAQTFGSKDFDSMRKFIGNTIWLALGFAAVLTVGTCLLCNNILTWMNTQPEFFKEAHDYIFVIFLGIPVTFLYNILSGIMRSLGDSRTPVYFLVISSLLNVVLDIFLIVVMDMGVAGAGFATVISQLVSGILCFVYMAKKFDIIRLKKEDLKPEPYFLGRLCAVGLPMGLQYSITAIGSILLQTAVNGLGSAYVAAVTAGSKVSQLMCCPYDAMGSTMATYGGQNMGAGRLDRIKKGLIDCSLLGIIYAVAAFMAILLFGGSIAMMFIKEGQENVDFILELAKKFLTLNVMFYIPLAFVNIVRFLIQGMGFSQIAVFAGVFEMAARGIVALCFVPMFGYTAVCLASPSAWILADVFLIPAFLYCSRVTKKRLEKSGRLKAAETDEQEIKLEQIPENQAEGYSG